MLLSASPDLYVPHIGRALDSSSRSARRSSGQGDRLLGSLKSANRRGAEKLLCLERLRARYPGLAFAAYGNSASDLDHMRRADRALLVNGNAAARKAAARLGIPVSTWA